MMELADSTSDGLRDSNSATRSGLGIDLNEIPSPAEVVAEAIDVVRSFHDNPSPPPGPPAGVPGADAGAACGACGKAEELGYVVVCDACERGFHVGCAGMRGVLEPNEEWLCGDCLGGGAKSKRWPLGAQKRLLDINASPPSDADAEEGLELRKHAFGGNPFGASVTYSNFLCGGNGFGFPKPSGILVGFEELLHGRHTVGRSFEDLDMKFPMGRCKGINNTAVRKQSQNPSEIFLQALREFVYERHGELEEGWRVEFKQSIGSELYAVYCAPDGKIFDSVYEVALYLGLISSRYNSKDPEIRTDGCISMSEKTLLPRKRKARRSLTNGFPQHDEICSATFDNNVQLSEAVAGETEKNKEGLPVQFEDFFLLSYGKVDTRSSYHDANTIWPIGFKSCWHDKITGSLFISEVLDGGNDGPVFKVKRISCSSLAIPTGSTVIFKKHGDSSSVDEELVESFDHYDNIQMILSDACPSMENDILSCLNTCYIHESTEPVSSRGAGLFDEIGEFSVEEKSSSLAWKVVTQKVVDAFCEFLKRKGKSEYLCEHIRSDGSVPRCITKNRNHAPLDKFSSSPETSGVPSFLEADEEHKDLLGKWLDQDRFGLNVDFVQEILEQRPGVQTCLEYQMLCQRSSCSSALTVGNELLVLKRRGGSHGKENDTYGVYRRSKKVKLVDDRAMNDNRRPEGRKLCLKVSSELVGDVYQVWQSFWRFCEILSLKEPLSLEELEEELINPWSENLELLDKYERVIRDDRALHSNGSGDIHAFIQMDTGEMKEAAQTKLASVTYSRCTGLTLTKAHKSLLRVLVSELQYKVAALVDPNFDCGESKSKRGRKKEVDSSVLAKRSKLNILPINELTWPELARRYILAVISMEGNLDSAEIVGRESSKVFRCLQGDGGVLCGSLTGVAAMEADALYLAEATKQIFGSAERENDVVIVEDEGCDEAEASEKKAVSEGSTPEWAVVLEPVRKLPTNVGTRIRKCVHEALALNPPEWAKQRLEYSISKEVYKGNASGPTKKAVLSVLAEVTSPVLPAKPDSKLKKKKSVVCRSDVVMRQCRIVLRRAAAADDSKVFCNLLGRKLMNSNDNDDEGLLGTPAMVSRPLDFRTIDLRLAAGAYCGSHQSFLEDVRELWSNVRNAFSDQPDSVELAESLSQNFESLYEKEVISLVDKLSEFGKLESLDEEKRKEMKDIVTGTNLIPKAPWDEGVCKVCGIDRDDDSVLLCDTCDAEYHTYCLNPPLARIPQGNWYCPSCVVSKRILQQLITQRPRQKYHGEVTRLYLDSLSNLAAKMEHKEYWEYTLDQRIFLVKFLCDELLNSTIIRQHLEQCGETSTELQQKLRSLFAEWKNLKSREEILAAKVAKLESTALNPPGPANFEKSQTPSVSDKSNGCNDLPASASDSQHSSHNLVDAEDQLNCHNNDGKETCSTGNEHESVGKDSCSTSTPLNELQAHRVELNSVKNDITALQQSLSCIESELLRVAVRREFLGTDSLGCLYWASGSSNGHSCIVVDGSAALQIRRNTNELNFLNPYHLCGQINAVSPSWVSYQTDEEVDELIGCLNSNDQRERELRESIFHWQKLRLQVRNCKSRDHETVQALSVATINGKDEPVDDSLTTKAANLLEKRYGPCVEFESSETLKSRRKRSTLTDDDKMYRCECLELVLPGLHHCLSCHRTFPSDTELEKHNEGNKCVPALSKEKGKEISLKPETAREDQTGEKGTMDIPPTGFSELSAKLIKFQNEGEACPYDLEKICSKFVTRDSCKDLIQEIGLIGSNGVLSFIPSLATCLSDSTIALISSQKNAGTPDTVERSGQNGDFNVTAFCQDGLNNRSPKRSTKEISEVSKFQRETEISRCCVVPQSSLRPLTGKVSQILRRLKINLLDMDASLPEEALRETKSCLGRRWAWRAFVKSATTIYEMVQATVILEDTIKTEYMKNEWWYWSSFSAAAKTATVSSLSLRIYALDAAIIYEKTSSDSDPTENLEPSSLSEPKNLPVLDSSEKTRITRRSNKKRKEPEG